MKGRCDETETYVILLFVLLELSNILSTGCKLIFPYFNGFFSFVAYAENEKKRQNLDLIISLVRNN